MECRGKTSLSESECPGTILASRQNEGTLKMTHSSARAQCLGRGLGFEEWWGR